MSIFGIRWYPLKCVSYPLDGRLSSGDFRQSGKKTLCSPKTDSAIRPLSDSCTFSPVCILYFVVFHAFPSARPPERKLYTLSTGLTIWTTDEQNIARFMYGGPIRHSVTAPLVSPHLRWARQKLSVQTWQSFYNKWQPFWKKRSHRKSLRIQPIYLKHSCSPSKTGLGKPHGNSTRNLMQLRLINML